MTTTRRDILRRYAADLSAINSSWGLKRESKRFKAEHRIADDHPLSGEMNEIFGAHDRRVGGLSSPNGCDEEARKVIELGGRMESKDG